jgi:hypothetical protein
MMVMLGLRSFSILIFGCHKLMRFVSALVLLFASAASLTVAFAPIKPGDSLPAANLHSGSPPDLVRVTDYAKGKNMIIVGLPGAFTPT